METFLHPYIYFIINQNKSATEFSKEKNFQRMNELIN